MPVDYNIEGYERLCAAVVERAVYDYKGALIRLQKKPHDISAKKLLNDCERFFRNEISMYSDLDGEVIMQKIRNSISKELGK